MKIVYLIDDFPPLKWTSSGTLTLNLAIKMMESGHEVFVITTVQQAEKAGESDFMGLKVYKIFSKYHIRWRAYGSLYNPHTVHRVREILQAIKPDISHFQHIHQYISYYCFKIAKKYSQAVFLTAHDVMLFNYGKMLPKNGSCYYKVSFLDHWRFARKWYNPWRNLVIRHYLKYLNKVFTVSDSLKMTLAANGIGQAARIYNSIDRQNWLATKQAIEDFKKEHQLIGKQIILFGGRLSQAKGGEVILRALLKILSFCPNAVLLVVGEKDNYAGRMLEIVEDLKISQAVKFTGWLDRNLMKLAFFSCDVCVTPSLCCDPFNLFNIEAGAAGKPVVGTCFGGTSEIVLDGQTGYIVDPNNIELMAEKIVDLLKNPQRAHDFGEAGYQRVRDNFSLERQATETLAWYKKFLPNG